MRFSTASAAAMLVATLFTAAGAAPITYRLEGFASGSVGATTFSNAMFTWTLSSNTVDAVPLGGGEFIMQFSANVLDIAGIGIVTPIQQLFGGTGFGITGHSVVVPNSVAIIPEVGDGGLVFGAPGLAFYSGIAPIGPLSVTLGDSGPLDTGKGDLSFTSLEMMFQASIVPEPVTLALFGAGLAGIGATRRRRKTLA